MDKQTILESAVVLYTIIFSLPIIYKLSSWLSTFSKIERDKLHKTIEEQKQQIARYGEIIDELNERIVAANRFQITHDAFGSYLVNSAGARFELNYISNSQQIMALDNGFTTQHSGITIQPTPVVEAPSKPITPSEPKPRQFNIENDI